MGAALPTDSDLARKLIDGEDGAFENFVDVYYAKLFRYSYAMCSQREDAEEVAQDTLLRVFESLNQLREPDHLKSWVFRIAKNACLMKRRKSVFAPKTEISLDELKPKRVGEDGGMRLEIADWSALPEDLALDAEMRRQLERAVHELPDSYKSVFLLRDIEELSTGEAAEVLGVTPDVVKTRLHRARLALRKSLDEYMRESRA
jgi:RNA polymerase sigma-70 factor (ECF subfamily)